jgi:opacity protein-like surface antigen
MRSVRAVSFSADGVSVAGFWTSVLWISCVVALLVIQSAPVGAQGYPDRMSSEYGDDASDTTRRPDGGPLSIRTGLGFTADPDAFLMGFEIDYRIIEEGFSIGTLVQLGIDDDWTIVSPVLYGRYTANLGDFEPNLDRIDLYLQGGLGFTWWDVDRPNNRGGDDDDNEFLTNFGFGAEYRLTDHVSAGTHMLFNIVPGEIYDERFYFSWEVVTLRYRF